MADFHPSRDHRCQAASLTPMRTSLVARSTITLRAATTTPVESSGAFHARFPDDIDLPRYYGESASTTTFRGLLSVHSRCGPQSPLVSFETVSRSASAHLLPPGPPLVLPAGARVGQVGFAPTNQTCLYKAHTTTRWRTPYAPLPSARKTGYLQDPSVPEDAQPPSKPWSEPPNSMGLILMPGSRIPWKNCQSGPTTDSMSCCRSDQKHKICQPHRCVG